MKRNQNKRKMKEEIIRMGFALVAMLGILLALLIAPSYAQGGLPGECWNKITTCISDSASQGDFRQQCCPVITQEIEDERECFCSVKPIFLQNATIANDVTQLLSLCSVNFNTTCPDKFEEAPCWKTISDCIGNNVNNTLSEPQFHQSSPLFNATEFLCCPLIQETAITEKQCFCTINTFAQQNTSFAQNTSDFLSVCGFPNTAASLNDFCQDQAPSPAPALSSMSPIQGEGSLESLKTLSPSTDVAQRGAANKIATTGSLSSMLVFLTYLCVFN